MGSWVLLLVLLGLVTYLISGRIFKRQEKVDIPKVANPKIVTIWHANLGDADMVVHPYYFDRQQQQFHDQVLNQIIPQANFTYYKLWLVNFQPPSVAFTDTLNTVTLSLQDGPDQPNFAVSPLLGQVKATQRPLIAIFCQTEKIPAGYLKEYLLAFPISTEADRIQKIAIVWNGETHSFTRHLSLKRYLDEYVQRPTPSFWNEPRNQE
jgi:hypothetical protein